MEGKISLEQFYQKRLGAMGYVQGLGMGVQSMLLTLSRQVVLPIAFIAILSRFRNVLLI